MLAIGQQRSLESVTQMTAGGCLYRGDVSQTSKTGRGGRLEPRRFRPGDRPRASYERESDLQDPRTEITEAAATPGVLLSPSSYGPEARRSLDPAPHDEDGPPDSVVPFPGGGRNASSAPEAEVLAILLSALGRGGGVSFYALRILTAVRPEALRVYLAFLAGAGLVSVEAEGVVEYRRTIRITSSSSSILAKTPDDQDTEDDGGSET